MEAINSLLQEIFRVVKGLAPAADRWNTNPVSDAVKVSYADLVTFLVHQEGGTTGKATLTVEACDDAAGTNPVAIPFKYQIGGTGYTAGTGDVLGAVTDAAAAGFDTVPATDRIYLLSVRADTVPNGKSHLRLKCTESVNDPVNGSVHVFLSSPRYGTGTGAPSVIA